MTKPYPPKRKRMKELRNLAKISKGRRILPPKVKKGGHLRKDPSPLNNWRCTLVKTDNRGRH